MGHGALACFAPSELAIKKILVQALRGAEFSMRAAPLA